MNIDQKSKFFKKNLKINININENIKEVLIDKKKYKYILKLSDEKFSKIDAEILLKKIIFEGDFKNFIINLDINFYLIIWSDDYLFCTVDHVSTYQLLYNINDSEINIYNNISDLNLKKKSIIEKSIYYSGYSISNLTIFNELNSLLPCEYLVYKKNNLKINTYYNTNYLYQKDPSSSGDLNSTITKIFQNLKKKYNDCNIIVPLSSGIDSRFIVSALKHFSFKKVKLFTHYYLNRRDKIIANKISKYFNYPIEYVRLNINDSKKIYRSKNFNNYLNYNLSGNTINNHGDYISIKKLLKKKFLNLNEDIIMNGQSGDFITGNHIPIFLFDKKDNSIDYLLQKTLDYIIFKHFNLWSEKVINQDQKEIQKYIKSLYFNNLSSRYDLISMYEKFEFENRQVKWVVGQQKVYDFFGLNSYLPLWSLQMIDFFTKRVNIYQRKNQKFYKDFLIKKNYSNVWKNIPINPREKFTPLFRIVRFICKSFFFFLGKKNWYEFEKKYLNYFMDSTLISTFYDYKYFVKLKKIPRNTVALLARDYLDKK